MRNKILKALACFIAFILVMGAVPASAEDSQSIFSGIVDYKLNASSASNIQQWINGELAKNAGSTSEWYIMALSQSGKYDFSVYESALKKYLDKNKVYSASSRLKYALALVACGSTDSYIHNTLNDSIGGQGIMSWVYGLHLLSNGYKSDAYSPLEVKQKILSLQLSDGGWAITGKTGDADVTAMTVQALAPYYNEQTVKTAVDSALTLLSDKQQSGGDYKSYGVGNPESTAQVLVALSSLGIDYSKDSRFIKDGNTLLDGIKKYQLNDGSFCHKSGDGYNENATTQVFYSMAALGRFKDGKGDFYLLDGRNPSGLKIPAATTQKQPATQNLTQSVGKTETAQRTEGSPAASKAEKTTAALKKDKPQKSQAVTSVAEKTTLTQSRTKRTKNADKASRSTAAKISGKADITAVETEKASASSESASGSYKPWAVLVIVVVAGGICLILFVAKKRNKKNLFVILIIAAAAICVCLATDFQSTDSYYSGKNNTDAVGTVTLEIRCDAVAGKEGYIPKDGVILEKTEFEIQDGDTVFDVLQDAGAQYKIHMEKNGADSSVYIEGIHNIYELQFGDLSGWRYYVNEKEPSVSCGEHELTDGDEILWSYTLDLGQPAP